MNDGLQGFYKLHIQYSMDKICEINFLHYLQNEFSTDTSFPKNCIIDQLNQRPDQLLCVSFSGIRNAMKIK